MFGLNLNFIVNTWIKIEQLKVHKNWANVKTYRPKWYFNLIITFYASKYHMWITIKKIKNKLAMVTKFIVY